MDPAPELWPITGGDGGRTSCGDRLSSSFGMGIRGMSGQHRSRCRYGTADPGIAALRDRSRGLATRRRSRDTFAESTRAGTSAEKYRSYSLIMSLRSVPKFLVGASDMIQRLVSTPAPMEPRSGE